MALDADPEVVAVAAQPMWLHWADTGSGRAVRHAPDYFARRADGTGVVIDVRPGQRIGERARRRSLPPRGFAHRWAGSINGSASETRSAPPIYGGWPARSSRDRVTA
jgi:hypothetical protein